MNKLANVIRKKGYNLYRKVFRKLNLIPENREMNLEAAKATGLYYCPCCQRVSKKMIVGHYFLYPEKFKQSLYSWENKNVICPECRSLPRHRMLVHYYETYPEVLEKSNSILYFAVEKSVKRWLDRNNISYVSADLMRKADLQLDIMDTGMEDESWDLIVCNHVLEHVADFRKALAEVKRILKSDGTFICSFPMLLNLDHYVENCSEELTKKERIKQFGQYDHLRIFGSDSQMLLEEAGFEVTAFTKEECPKEICPKDGPADYDVTMLFICKKK